MISSGRYHHARRMAFHSSCRPFSSLETRRRLPFAAHPPPLRAPKAQITRAFAAWASSRTRFGFLQLHAHPPPSPPSVFRSLRLDPPSPCFAEERQGFRSREDVLSSMSFRDGVVSGWSSNEEGEDRSKGARDNLAV